MSSYSYINTRDVGRTREKVQNHEPEASGSLLLRVFSQHPKCLYTSTKTCKRVSYCFYKMTEHLPLCKNYLISKWSSSKLSRKLSKRALIQSESSTVVLTCIRGQVWVATRKCWLCSWNKFRTPKNDAAEKCPESVTVQVYCQKLTMFIRWSRRNVVAPANVLSTKSTFLSLRLDVLVVWSKLTWALDKFAVMHLICFVLGTILEENERLPGTHFEKKSPRYRSRVMFTTLSFQEVATGRQQNLVWTKQLRNRSVVMTFNEINLHFFA